MKSVPVRRILIVPAIISTGALSLLLVFAIGYFSFQNLSQVFRSQLEATTDLMVESISNPLLMGQSEIVYRSCRLMTDHAHIVGIRVESKVLDTTICEINREVEASWNLKVSRTVPYQQGGADIAGSVEVVYDLSALKRNVMVWIGFALLLAFFVVFLQAWLYQSLAQKIGIPLSEISDILANGSADSLAVQQWRSNEITEIDMLTGKISEMAIKMVGFQQTLKIRERDRVTGELARQIAHDIRSPLGVLRILKEKLTVDPVASTELISAVVERIESMANSLLLKSKLVPRLTTYDEISSSIGHLCKSFRAKAALREVNIGWSDPPSAVGATYVNVMELERIVSNLIENALDATPAQGTVTVELSIDKFLNIIVRDEGPGLPEAAVRDLGTTSMRSTKPNGNGLGLKSVYDTVGSWAGSVSYNFADGACFVISLPFIPHEPQG